jgi:hypothetical protein
LAEIGKSAQSTSYDQLAGFLPLYTPGLISNMEMRTEKMETMAESPPSVGGKNLKGIYRQDVNEVAMPVDPLGEFDIVVDSLIMSISYAWGALRRSSFRSRANTRPG